MERDNNEDVRYRSVTRSHTFPTEQIVENRRTDERYQQF